MTSATDSDELGDYSRATLREILIDFPDWASFVTYSTGGFAVEVPPPVGGTAPLVIWTEDDEVSVGFERWHTHFDRWDELSSLGLPWTARDFVAKLVAEEVASAVKMHGEEWGGSWIVLDPANGPALEEPLKPGEVVHVRSWAGRWDADLGAPPAASSRLEE